MSDPQSWGLVSQEARSWMEKLGNFSPTVRSEDRMIKGYTYEDGEGGKEYHDSNDLRNLANACTEVANWLDARADSMAKEKAE